MFKKMNTRAIALLFSLTLLGVALTIFNSDILLNQACAHNITDAIVIHLDEDGFDPKEITIQTGTKVVFENSGFDDVWPASDDHPTHEDYSDLDPRRPLLPGEVWEFTFNEPGEYGLHDHIKPISLGEIIVEGEQFTSSEAKLVNQECSEPGDSEEKPVISSNDFIAPVEPGKSALDIVVGIKSECALGDHLCVESYLGDTVTVSGGEAPLSAYKQLIDESFIDFEYGNGHQFAHRIGRKIAASFGVGIDQFSLCSDEYNFGCQHGYFEWVLGRTSNTTEAMELICESLEGVSESVKANCYHGGGHGIMMSLANDHQLSLAECDKLNTETHKGDCYQGVFMENVQADFRGEARQGVFGQDNLLEPCESLDPKYKTECYIYHGSWLIYDRSSIGLAAAECMKEQQPTFSDSCLRGVGINIANSGRENLINQESTGDPGVDSWNACREFPEWKYGLCIDSVIEGYSNIDILNISNRLLFCEVVDVVFESQCFEKLVDSIRWKSGDIEEFIEVCSTIERYDKLDCKNMHR